MSAASLLKVYDGLDPELAFPTAGPGAVPTLAEVLASGASGNGVAITDAGDITGVATSRFDITSGAGQGVKVEGLVGASLKATTGGCTLEATAGALTLTSATAPPAGLVLTGAGLASTAANTPGSFAAARFLAVTIDGATRYIPLATAAW